MSTLNELKTLIRMNTSNFFKLLNDLEKQKRIAIQRALKLRRRAKYSRLRAAFLALYLLYRRPQEKRIWTMKRRGQYWEDEVSRFSSKKFKTDFRVSKETFEWLVGRLYSLGRQNNSLQKAISLRKRIAIALYALGSCVEYKNIGNLFGVSQRTITEIVCEFCKVLYDTLKDEYLNAYPPTRDKLNEIVGGFEKLGFPQCFGVLDERYVELRIRKDYPVDYYKINGKYSIIMLSVIDHKSRFSYINFGAPGKCKNALLFDQSNLKSYHEKSILFKECSRIMNNLNVPIILIGNSFFTLSEIVLTPYEEFDEDDNNDESLKHKIFNKKLLKCKKVADNAFKQLSARWKRFNISEELEFSIDSVMLIARACCLLHNICIEKKDDIWDILLNAECEMNEKYVWTGYKNESLNNDEFGNSIRNNIAEYFLTLPSENKNETKLDIMHDDEKISEYKDEKIEVNRNNEEDKFFQNSELRGNKETKIKIEIDNIKNSLLKKETKIENDEFDDSKMRSYVIVKEQYREIKIKYDGDNMEMK